MTSFSFERAGKVIVSNARVAGECPGCKKTIQLQLNSDRPIMGDTVTHPDQRQRCSNCNEILKGTLTVMLGFDVQKE